MQRTLALLLAVLLLSALPRGGASAPGDPPAGMRPGFTWLLNTTYPGVDPSQSSASVMFFVSGWDTCLRGGEFPGYHLYETRHRIWNDTARGVWVDDWLIREYSVRRSDYGICTIQDTQYYATVPYYEERPRPASEYEADFTSKRLSTWVVTSPDLPYLPLLPFPLEPDTTSLFEAAEDWSLAKLAKNETGLPRLVGNSTGIREAQLQVTMGTPQNLTFSLSSEQTLKDPNATWTERTFEAVPVTIRDLNVTTNPNGSYEVWWYSREAGWVVQLEVYDHLGAPATSVSRLAYLSFEECDAPGECEPPPEEQRGVSGSSYLLWGGIGIVFAILSVGVYRIRRRELEEGAITRAQVEAATSRVELVELCEEAGLSTKGSKKQLRARLLEHVEELERRRKARREAEEAEDEVADAEDAAEASGEEADDLDAPEEDADEETGPSEAGSGPGPGEGKESP